MSLFDALSAAATVLDTPGAAVRSALMLENPLEAAINPKKRRSGADLLRHYNILGPNDAGIGDDIAGFVAENLLDPTNLIGGGIAAKVAKGLSKAKKVNKAAKASNEMVAAGNLFRDQARSKLKEALAAKATDQHIQQRMAENLIFKLEHPERVFDVSKPRKGVPAHMSREGAMALSYGSPEKMAEFAHEVVAPGRAARGGALPSEAIASAERAGVHAIPFTKTGTGPLGFVHPVRPDFVFLASNRPEGMASTFAHEMVHSTRGKHPEVYEKLLEAVGPDVVKRGSERYYGGEIGKSAAESAHRAMGLSGQHVGEEGLAEVLANSSHAGLNRAPEAIANMEGVVDRDEAAKLVAEILSGAPNRRKALVPVGRPETVFEHVKSFAKPKSTGMYEPLKPGEWGLTPDEALIGLKPYMDFEPLVPERRKTLAALRAALLANIAAHGLHGQYTAD